MKFCRNLFAVWLFCLPAVLTAQDIEVTDLNLEQYLDELGYFEGITDVVDGDISGPTWDAMARFAGDYGVDFDGIWPTNDFRLALRKAVLERREMSGAPAPAQAKLEAPTHFVGAVRFDALRERNGVQVAISTRHDCADGASAMAIISDTPEALPAGGVIAAALGSAGGARSISCQRRQGLETVLVLTSGGGYAGKAYLVRSGQFAFPYDRLTVDMARWLENDPGLPFARIAPDFVNLISGEWRAGRHHIGGPTQMKSILFQFALKDAALCPAAVGETDAYRLTMKETDQYGNTTVTDVDFVFDAEWTDVMLRILGEGNHIGSRLGGFSDELIRHYGCASPEIAMMREDLIAFARAAYDLERPAGGRRKARTR